MSDASLTVRMALDRLALKQGFDGAGKDVDNFKKKFESSLRDTRGAVKDVAGSIDGIGRAFEGNVGGAISGLRDLIQLIPVSPWAAMAAAGVGAFTAIAKHAENTQNAISDALDKSIGKWKKFRDEAKKLAEENKQLEEDKLKPKGPSSEAIDYATKKLDAAEANVSIAEKENQRLAQRIKLIRDAKAVFDEYAKAYGEQAAKEMLAPSRKSPMGQSVSAQRESLKSRGILFPEDIIRDMSTKGDNVNKAEEDLARSVRDIEKAKNAKLEAEKELTTEKEKYEALRKTQADEAQKAADKRDDEAEKKELARVTKSIEAHNARVKKAPGRAESP